MVASRSEFTENDETANDTGLNEDTSGFHHKRNKISRPIEADGFDLYPSKDAHSETVSFLEQFEQEVGRPGYAKNRLREIHSNEAAGFTEEELIFGARIAWRNSIRCVGRMFWPSLHIFDRRSANSLEAVFEAIIEHITWSTNGGDLRPAISVFRAGHPELRILNTQLILYAGYKQRNGQIVGDPKNIALTNLATKLGWKGQGSEFDILPLILREGTNTPQLFEIPKDRILQVPIRHPEFPRIDDLGLRWFVLPAVASMALDMGGTVYSAAPTSGIYQGTEIGSFNLADPRRYNKLEQIALAIGLDTHKDNPLWRDQALVEINRAVLYSFKANGVRIMDHHALSESFRKFYDREKIQGRKVHGHWPWIVPPMSSNLSWIWHEEGFKKVILKPGYFYQKWPDDLA